MGINLKVWCDKNCNDIELSDFSLSTIFIDHCVAHASELGEFKRIILDLPELGEPFPVRCGELATAIEDLTRASDALNFPIVYSFNVVIMNVSADVRAMGCSINGAPTILEAGIDYCKLKTELSGVPPNLIIGQEKDMRNENQIVTDEGLVTIKRSKPLDMKEFDDFRKLAKQLKVIPLNTRLFYLVG